METIEKSVIFDNLENIKNLFGNFDENINIINDAFGIKIIVRNNELKYIGDDKDVSKASYVVSKLLEITSRGENITKQTVSYLVDLAKESDIEKINTYMSNDICISFKGRHIRPKTHGQITYINTIKNSDITFGIGPAGTGKTFLAVAMATTALKNKEVSRIIVTRPAVEAGEKLGFLPGDMQEKVDPYLRPIYDALSELLGPETYLKYIERGIIEIAPLAFMRGRTLESSFIILDEAQNTTPEQMKMFLTRTGLSSKVVITGDVTQIDLPKDKKSGLIESIRILKDIEEIKIIYLSEKDVVRHHLVQKIIKAYEKANEENQAKV